MKYSFVKLSDLRAKAVQEVTRHLESVNRGANMLGNLIGGPGSHKEWASQAKAKHEASLSVTGHQRMNYVLGSLFEIYKCEAFVQFGRYIDDTLVNLKMKMETSYLNMVLDFVETNIHNEQAILTLYDVIQQAILVLAEENQKLAKSYQTILDKHKNVQQAYEKIQTLLRIPYQDFTSQHSQNIKSLYAYNEALFNQHLEMKEDLFVQLKNKLDEILEYSEGFFNKEKECENPSLFKLLTIIRDFREIFEPLKTIINAKRYFTFLDLEKDYQHLVTFLNSTYPELKTSYEYLSLPRTNLNVKNIFTQYKNILKCKELEKHPFIELKELNPDLNEILSRFEMILSDYYKSDILQYYNIYNDLINAEDTEDKIGELIRFHKHLDFKARESKDSAFLFTKISSMKKDVLDNLDGCIRREMEAKITHANNLDEVKLIYDKIIRHLINLEDMSRLEKVQNEKNAFLKSVTELQALEKNLDENYKQYGITIDPFKKNKYKNILKQELSALTRIFESIQKYHFLNLDKLSQKMQNMLSQLDFKVETSHKSERLIILDKFSLKNFVIYAKKDLTFGRDASNDIILKSEWVSAKHWAFVADSKTLVDADSTNGTFINDLKARQASYSLNDIYTFTLADSFEFTLKKNNQSFAFNLLRILDKKLLMDLEQKEYVHSLFNTDYYWLMENDELTIHKSKAKLNEPGSSESDLIRIRYENGAFFVTDQSKDVYMEMLEYSTEDISDRFSFHMF